MALYSGNKLKGIKWLCNIIICTKGQTGYLITVLTLGRKKYNGKIIIFSDFERCLESVHMGHHYVKNKTVNLVVLDYLKDLAAVCGSKNIVTLLLQINFYRIEDSLVIITNQNRVHKQISLSLILNHNNSKYFQRNN